MANPYITKVENMVNSSGLEMTWSTVEQAKGYIAIIQQLQKKIRLVKSEITLAKKQIHANFASQKAHIGKGLGAGFAKGLFGAKTMGKAHTITRSNIRHRELQALQPYEEAKGYITTMMTALDM